MKLLYVGNKVDKVHFGGDVVNNRNIYLLQNVFKSGYEQFSMKHISKLHTFVCMLLGYMNGLSPVNVLNILRKIQHESYDYVFLSSSKMGKLAYWIKKKYPQTKVVTYFHNIEKQYCEEECRVNNSIKNRLIAAVVNRNEKQTCECSDRILVLNERDNKLLDAYYGRKADMILPVTIKDRFDEEKRLIARHTRKTEFTILFVGSAFFANIEGVNWFINQVLPRLSGARLIVVGNNMDKYFNAKSNVEVHGYVEDLEMFYYQCDVVALPIFSGGGMKTKTVEALMYGCPVVGTKEAFEGYDLDYNRIGGCCNDAGTMVGRLQYLMENRETLISCSQYARIVFSDKYETDNYIKVLSGLLIGH